ncbi:hypothetical protein V8E55_000099 [Tylopilus felleus]
MDGSYHTEHLKIVQVDAMSHFDVEKAEDTYNELARQLSRQSAHLDRSKQTSRTASVYNGDLEKGDEAEKPFGLRDYLTSSNDANQAAGIKHKHVGVTWEDLHVGIIGEADQKASHSVFFLPDVFLTLSQHRYTLILLDSVINFFLAPLLWIWGYIMRFIPHQQSPTRTILHKSSGVLKPGEMCLVLGCPGAGCPTFLKTIANQWGESADVGGDVRHAGIDDMEMAKYYKGEVAYNQECAGIRTMDQDSGPNGRLSGVSRSDTMIQDAILKMLNISHTHQTLVGDEFVCGVSGGERKRVSIAEMMATRARVQCWDNSTRGLDASTALDFVRSLRIMTDILGQTTFVSLYQAGESIYELFDKVLILDKGRQVYFGPASEARAYFENLGYRSLPRQGTPDYLTGARCAGEFITFHLFIYMAYLAMQGFFRTYGLLFVSFDSVFRLATLKRWLLWISYLNPLSYAWAGLMENEFMRTSLVYTLFGAKPSDVIIGNDYLEAGYGITAADIWRRNLVVLVAFVIFFLFTQVVVIEYFSPKMIGGSVYVYAKEDKETKVLNEILHERKGRRHEKLDDDKSQKQSRDEDMINLQAHRRAFTWENLTYHVPVRGGTRRLLYDVCGYVKPGTLTALVGASGAGDIFVDGRPIGADFARGTAYANEGTATVREALRFSAYLRQLAEVPIKEKNRYVEEIIELLELHRSARDDSAWNLVRFLRKLADQGQAFLCTIHQPSSLLFENFDPLLILETVYFGDIGKDSQVIRDYFSRNGAVCPPNVYPAEYMLEAIGAGLSPRVGPRDWKDIWLDSPEYQGVRAEIDEIKAQGLAIPVTANNQTRTFATSFLCRLRTVVKRNNTALWRSPNYVFSRLFVHAFISLFNVVPELGTQCSRSAVSSFCNLEPMFIFNRRIFIREASSRIYSPYVFAIAQLIGEIPYSMLSTDRHIHGIIGVSIGQVVAALSPSIQIAVLFNPFIGISLGLLCGVTIPYPSMTSCWRWLYQLVPYTRTLSAMLSTELHSLVIRCASDEFNVFNLPANQTCQEWAGDFVDAFAGYLDNPSATSLCRYCHYSVGDEFFTPMNIAFDNRWRDAFILFSYFVFNVIVTIATQARLTFAP